jgi:hypothetical protein
MKRFTNFQSYINALTFGFDFISKTNIINTITKNDVMFANDCVSESIYKKTNAFLIMNLKSFSK